MAQTKRLTRRQISDFIQTERGVRAFEDVQSDILSADSGITNATFLTLGAEPSLGSERVFGPVPGELVATDGGANGVYALGLADAGAGAATYGDATHFPTITLDSKGRVSAVTLKTVNRATNPPTSVTATTYTVLSTDDFINYAATATSTVTLGTATAGRVLYIRNSTAFAINSASSNVVPLTSGTAGTAILAATAGKWAKLVGDGTNWITFAAN